VAVVHTVVIDANVPQQIEPEGQLPSRPGRQHTFGNMAFAMPPPAQALPPLLLLVLLLTPLLLLLLPPLLLLPLPPSLEASPPPSAGVAESSPQAATTAVPSAATKKINSFFIELRASTERLLRAGSLPAQRASVHSFA